MIARPPWIIATLLAASFQFALAAEDAGPTGFPDLVYATTPERDLCVDVFVAKGVERPPLVIYIHGGGWKTGSRKAAFAKRLAARGFAVASIDYRFSSQAKFPARAIASERSRKPSSGFSGHS